MTTSKCPGPEELLAFLHGEGNEALRRHLEDCPGCRALLEELRRLETVLRSSPPERESGVCPPPAAFRDFVAGRLAAEARQSLEAHAARCRRCLDVLAAAHDETALERMALSPGLRERLLGMAPLVVEESPARPAARPRTRRFRFHRLAGSGTSAAVPVAVAAAVLLAVVGIVALSTSRPSPTPERIVVHPPPPPEPPPHQPPREPRPDEQMPAPKVKEPEKRTPELPRPQAPESPKPDEPAKPLEIRPPVEPPKPPPPPERKPEPSRPTEPRPAETIIASVLESRGEVFLVEGSSRTAVLKGAPIASGRGLETAAREGRASIKCTDGTRVDLGSGTQVRAFTEGAEAGKHFDLVQGALTADVRKQPAGRPLKITTSVATIEVLGTRFTLVAGPDTTLLKVEEGRVRLTSRLDGASVEVGIDHYAVVSKGLTLNVRPSSELYLVERFDDPRKVDQNWILRLEGRDAKPKLDGRLEFLPLAAGKMDVDEVYSRQPFPPILRVSMDVEISHANLLAGFTFVPRDSFLKADNKEAILFTLSGARREMRLGLGNGWQWNSLETAPAPAPSRERWTLELDGDKARLLVDGKEVFQKAHGGKVHALYHLRLEGTAGVAGPNAPPGSYVRYSNLRVEKLAK